MAGVLTLRNERKRLIAALAVIYAKKRNPKETIGGTRACSQRKRKGQGDENLAGDKRGEGTGREKRHQNVLFVRLYCKHLTSGNTVGRRGTVMRDQGRMATPKLPPLVRPRCGCLLAARACVSPAPE